MSAIDYAIVGFMLLLVAVLGFYARRFAGSVVNFLAAGRCARRYVLAVSEGVAHFGAISTVAGFEIVYRGGITPNFWGMLTIMAMVLLTLSGWCIYRFRETRALTVGQFIEARYSRKLRIFMGIVSWAGGVLNFGLFPAVGTRFFMYFCRLPEWNVTWLGMEWSLMYIMLMLLLLSFVLFLIFIGGQIAVIITDFVQGIFCNFFALALAIGLLVIFNWHTLAETLVTYSEPGRSLIDPFKSVNASDFNVWYYLIVFFGFFYGAGAGGGSQCYRSAALNPHEAQMGQILANGRYIATMAVTLLIPVACFTFMRNPEFAASVPAVQAEIDAISDATIRHQQTVSIVLRHILPVGLAGIMCTFMLVAFIGNHDTYMHTWGSVFIQDVLIPLRGKPLPQEQHIRYLKYSIFGVAAFIFLFSLLYKQNEQILMFFAMTGAIFLTGAGIVTVAGLYWSRGTTLAAWVVMIFGILFTVCGAIIRRCWPEFPIHSMYLYFIGCVIATLLFCLLSLLQRCSFDMDKLLHRGKYRNQDDCTTEYNGQVKGWQRKIGIDENFTIGDKVIYLGYMGWTFFLAGVFALIVMLNCFYDLGDKFWIWFWVCYIGVFLAINILVAIWYFIGGIHDFKDLFRQLKKLKPDVNDDGWVGKPD